MEYFRAQARPRPWQWLLCRLRAVLAASVVLGLTSISTAQELGDHRYTSEAIVTGLRIYTQQCALCHGPQGDLVDGVNLRTGQFRNASSDDDLRSVISNGAAEGRMPAFDLRADELAGVIAFIRAGFDPDGVAVRIGDPARGSQLFRGEGQCSECHRVFGEGPRTAPDLSDVGIRLTPANLQLNLVDPQAALIPINRPVRIVTRNEEVITGRRLNEDTYSVQVIDSNQRLRSLVKDQLVSYEVSEEPSKQPTELDAEQVADVVAYLLTLRGLE